MSAALLGVGVGLHLLAPLAATAAHRSGPSLPAGVKGGTAARTPLHGGRSGLATRRAQAAYDTVTIVAAIPVVVVLSTTTWIPTPGAWVAVPIAAALGAALPPLVWRANGQSVARRRTASAGTSRLPFVAAAEEILWRAAAPSLLVAAGVGPLSAAVGSAAGFLALHWYVARGWRGMPYLGVLTVLLTLSASVAGLAAAVALHAAHNLVIALLRPSPRAPRATAPPITSAVSW